MSVGKIPPHEAQELEACFRAHASYLFGRACVLTCGDQALAHDLVQAAFEAAAMTWQALEEPARRTAAQLAARDHDQYRSERLPT